MGGQVLDEPSSNRSPQPRGGRDDVLKVHRPEQF